LIKLVSLVLPYPTKDLEYYEKYYDDIIIYEAEKKPHYKRAITERNRFMIDMVDLVIVCVDNPIITVIQGSMSTAHLLGFIDNYEMDKLKRPKAKEKPVESFTPAEQKLIEQAVMADRREKMKGIIICLYTGFSAISSMV
jgi:hypothetical protein